MARKRSKTEYERVYQILLDYHYKISDDSFVSLNGSGVLGKIFEEGKLEILSSAPKEHKITLEDHSLQHGINYIFKD